MTSSPDPTQSAPPGSPDPGATRDPEPDRTRSVADPNATTGDGVPAITTPVPSAAGRYTLGEEIARGGMGVVYRATDSVLGRDVAVKVLRRNISPASAVARRFADEARITGQLQHPAIPPVHDLGTFPDGRPFLAMKLVRGATLDELLRGRANPTEDRGRYVAVFEQICQALAYAHARKVIHRDLKPANVMVGAFGEVQVMDWGLAKLVSDGQCDAPEDPPQVTSLRSESADHTETGSVLGTPAFMPPEQASGATHRIGTRSDVFGLGAILAVILTGKPPFVGVSGESTRQMAANGRVGECFARLDGGGADPEWVALCKGCLAPDPDARPADAGEVAGVVAEFRQASEERARRAELDRVSAELQSVESRKRRRVQAALAAAVGLLLVGVGAFAWWTDRRAAEQRTAELRQEFENRQRATAETARLGRNVDALGGLLAQTSTALAAGDLAKATTLLDEAEKRVVEGGADDLRSRIAHYRAEVRLVRDLDAAERHSWNMAMYHLRRNDEQEWWSTALKAFGAEPDRADPAVVGKRIAGAAARDRFVSSFDGHLWTAKTDWVRKVLQVADPDPYRDTFRDAMFAKDVQRLAALAADPRALEQPIGFLVSLSTAPAIRKRGADGKEILVVATTNQRKRELLSHALTRHPNDVALLMALGQLPPRPNATADERLLWYQAATAAAPTVAAAWNNLGATLLDWREFARAEAAVREAIRLDPTDPVAWGNLGNVLLRRGNPTGSEAAFREALRLNPGDVMTHTNMAALLQAKGELPAAVAACREAIRLDPDCAPAHANLGFVLLDLGDRKGAEAAHRKALELWPEFAPAHNGLGNVLLDKGDSKGAEAEYREALRLNPRLPDAHFNLGIILREKRNLPESEAAHREALRLDPDHAPAHNGLGNALRDKGDLPAAIASFKEAIRIRPRFVFAYNNLGVVLAMKGDLEESIAAFEEALRLDPNNPGTPANLARARMMKADRDAKMKPRELAPPPRLVP